jgi:membrane protein
MLVTSIRTLVLVIREITDGDLNMRAMSLVYTTLLSLVPLLALSFSILKGFGVQNQLRNTLVTVLEPLGDEKAVELTDTIIGFVNNMNVGVLGVVGLGFLVFTVVSLMQKIESAFNSVWRIRLARSFGERFTTFLSAITVGPLLIFSAMAITGLALNSSFMGYVQSHALLGGLVDVLTGLLPFALIVTAFTFLYMFIPNTSVRLPAAFGGGLVAGILWKALSLGFTTYAAGASNYQLIYATFATAILFMIWLYLNWLILLIGASISFFRQHPEVVNTGLRDVHFSPALAENYSLSLLTKIGRRFYGHEKPYTVDALATIYDVPSHALEYCLHLLVEVGVLTETDETPSTFVPGVPFDTTTVNDVLCKIEVYAPDDTYSLPIVQDEQLSAITDAALESRKNVLAGLTLKQLAMTRPEDQAAEGS